MNTGVLALGGFLVVTGELTLGQLVASEIIVAAVVASFARLGKQLESFYDLLAAVEKVGTLFDLPVEQPLEARVQAATAKVPRASTRFGLDFSLRQAAPYSAASTSRSRPASAIALDGAPGAGKSVLDRTCSARLRTPSAGRVEVDGADAREI